MDSAKPTTMSRASSPARAPALFGKRGNHVAERRTIRCRHRARLEYPPPRKGPRQRGFSPYRAARPSAHGGLRRHFATRYGAPAAPSVGQNGSQDLEIEIARPGYGARAFPKRPRRGRCVCPIAGPGRPPPPRPCRRDRRPAPRARVHPRRAHPPSRSLGMTSRPQWPSITRSWRPLAPPTAAPYQLNATLKTRQAFRTVLSPIRWRSSARPG